MTVANRFRCASLVFALAATAVADDTLRDTPIRWHEDDRRHVVNVPEERDPNLHWDMFSDSIGDPIARFFDPTRWVRRASVPFGGNHVPSAANVNRLDEVPNSSWFTNRIGLYPLSPESLRRGPGGITPSTDADWVVVRAKTEGVTPGFTILDADGDLFLIKFDRAKYVGIASAAAAISQRIFHAAGYNVPDDNVVYFPEERLVVGEDVKLSLPDGSRRIMSEVDLSEILADVHRESDGRIRAISSKFLDGTPIGPFNYQSRRKDDPNDRVRHERRREVRGIAVFAAWLNHFDTKQQNSLDMFVEEEGRSFVKHYLIDFASTLGTGAGGPAQRFGWEVTVDPKAVVRRTANLGLWEDDWRKVERPEGLDEIGFFEAEHFEPMGFEPLMPNPAFADVTRRDGYWAAKIISAFTDEHLRVFVEEARYQNPAAVEYMVGALADRRDRIARAWFEQVAPLDFFRVDGGGLHYHDLGAERGLYPESLPRYRHRSAANDGEGERADWSAWVESDAPLAELNALRSSTPFVSIQCAVDRGDGWSDPITVHVACASGRVVKVERE